MAAIETFDIEDEVLTHLAACTLAITGIKRTFKMPPDEPIADTELPYAYGMTGATFEPIVRKSQGLLVVSRIYVQRLIITPITGGVNDPEVGAEIYRLGLPFHSRFAIYYNTHPELWTDTLQPLKGCTLVDMDDSGIVQRPAPGGTIHAAIDFSFAITVQRNIKRAPSPYVTT